MKKILMLMGFILLVFAGFTEAQVISAPVDPGFLEGLMNIVLAKFPKIFMLLFYMGLLRGVFKSMTLAYEAYVKLTPGKADDVRWGVAKQSKLFMFVEKLLDLFASIKLPVKK